MDERPSLRAANARLAATSCSADAIPRALAQADALLQQGRWSDAEQCLHAVLVHGAAEPALLKLLVRALLAQGKLPSVHALLREHCTAAATSPELRLFGAQVWLELGERRIALHAFQQVVDSAPDNGAAHLGLALALGQDGQSRAANASAQRAIDHGADHAGSHSVLARSFYELHQYDAAEAAYRRALQHHPWHTGAHAALAELVWLRTHDIDAALAPLEQARRQRPGMPMLELALIRARLLCTAGLAVQSLQELEAWIDAHPGQLALRVAAAKAAIEVDLPRAARHAEHALQLAPTHTGVLALNGDIMLATDRPAQAAELAQRLLARHPHDNHATALLSAAWRRLGDARHQPFHDYAALVQASVMDVPTGWSSLAHYLGDLAEELRREHGLLAEPVEQSVRGGTQIEHRLSETPMPAIRAFPQAIDGAIRRYLRRLRGGRSAWHQRAGDDYRLNGLWSVRLRSQGHHVSHFHGQGWISSACYIALPAAVNHGGEGWLTFGAPAWCPDAETAADYYLRPEPGLLVLFPSWMWHATVPFRGGDADYRQSMAFDVLPQAD